MLVPFATVFFRLSLILGLLCSLSGNVAAQNASTANSPSADAASPYLWRIEVSPYSLHYSNNENHRSVYLVGLERETSDRWFYGGVYFSNSFGQDSGYLYIGRSYYNIFNSLPRLYLKWSAGIMYGYKEPYENKVPLNYKGFSPAIIPALGWRFDGGWNGQVDVLGTAGLTFSVVKEF